MIQDYKNHIVTFTTIFSPCRLIFVLGGILSFSTFYVSIPLLIDKISLVSSSFFSNFETQTFVGVTPCVISHWISNATIPTESIDCFKQEAMTGESHW